MHRMPDRLSPKESRCQVRQARLSFSSDPQVTLLRSSNSSSSSFLNDTISSSSTITSTISSSVSFVGTNPGLTVSGVDTFLTVVVVSGILGIVVVVVVVVVSVAVVVVVSALETVSDECSSISVAQEVDSGPLSVAKAKPS